MNAREFQLGDVVLIPSPFNQSAWNMAIVTHVTPNEVKLVRPSIIPGLIDGLTDQIAPFLSLHEHIVSRKSDVPFQIVRRQK